MSEISSASNISINLNQDQLPEDKPVIRADTIQELNSKLYNLLNSEQQPQDSPVIVYSNSDNIGSVIEDAAALYSETHEYEQAREPFTQAVFDLENFNRVAPDGSQEAALLPLLADLYDPVTDEQGNVIGYQRGEINGYFTPEQHVAVTAAIQADNPLEMMFGSIPDQTKQHELFINLEKKYPDAGPEQLQALADELLPIKLQAPVGIADAQMQRMINDVTALVFKEKPISQSDLPSVLDLYSILSSLPSGVSTEYGYVDQKSEKRNSELLLQQLFKNPVAMQRLNDSIEQVITQLQQDERFADGLEWQIVGIGSETAEQAATKLTQLKTELEEKYRQFVAAK